MPEYAFKIVMRAVSHATTYIILVSIVIVVFFVRSILSITTQSAMRQQISIAISISSKCNDNIYVELYQREHELQQFDHYKPHAHFHVHLHATYSPPPSLAPAWLPNLWALASAASRSTLLPTSSPSSCASSYFSAAAAAWPAAPSPRHQQVCALVFANIV